MTAHKYQNTAGKTLWYTSFYYTDWQGKRRRTTKRGFSKKSEAVEYEKTFINSISKQPTVDFNVVLDDYIQDCTLRLKPTTMRYKKALIESKFRPYFGEMRLCDIDANTIRAWQNEMINYRDKNDKPFKDTYLCGMHRELSNIMTFGMKYYSLPANPCRIVGPMGKYDAEEMRVWTREQFDIFLKTEKKRPYHVAFNVLFYGGIREGELLALTPKDLLDDRCALNITKNFANVEGKDMMLSPKTDAGRRIVTLPKTVYDELKQYAKETGCASDQRIFYFKRAGLWNEFRNCTAEAQLPPIRIHDIRHSHVSMLIDMGFNVKQIADRVGHKNAMTTMRTYAHLYAGRDLELAKSLDEKIINDSGSGADSTENAKND